jgi:hypothetical protein
MNGRRRSGWSLVELRSALAKDFAFFASFAFSATHRTAAAQTLPDPITRDARRSTA